MPKLKCYQWLGNLAFLSDIMNHLNSLNSYLQGAGKFVSSLYDQVKAFRRKLDLMQKQQNRGDLSHYMARKKLIEEDWNGNDALKQLRSEMSLKTFSVINFNKSKWRAALSDEHLQSIFRIFTTQYTPQDAANLCCVFFSLTIILRDVLFSFSCND